ncbi:hypothetical protein T06_7442, partial [Trichinella sp. T6]
LQKPAKLRQKHFWLPRCFVNGFCEEVNSRNLVTLPTT